MAKKSTTKSNAKLLDSYPKLTIQQARCLLAYANQHGDSWKNDLRTDWMFSRARIHGEHSPELQQVRNFFGSAWLESVTLDELDRVAHPELP